LVAIARPHGAHNAIGLPRIYFNSRHSLISAADARSMLWVRSRFHALSDAFTVSCATCTEAIALASEDQTPIEIAIRENLVDSRRQITLSVGSEVIVELEYLATYPQPRGALGLRPSSESVEFEPRELIRLQQAIGDVSARPDSPVYLMSRGCAPGFLVTAVPEILGFVMPQRRGTSRQGITLVAHGSPEGESAAHIARRTLSEFDIREPVSALARIAAANQKSRGRRYMDRLASSMPEPRASGAEVVTVVPKDA
jgi:hypothetical protein